MPDQSLQNDPNAAAAASTVGQQTGNPAEVAGNTPSEAQESALAANVTEASEGQMQQADQEINRDPQIPDDASGPRTSGEAAADGYDDEEQYKYRDLQQLAKDRNLDASGKRDEIVARLRAADNTTSGSESPDVPRASVEAAQVENGGIQRSSAGQQHAEILQGLSAERRQQQLAVVQQAPQQD